MKNAWKGLVIGGLTGVAGGLLLDGLDRGARGASALSNKVAEDAPEVAGHLRGSLADAVTETAERIRDSNIPDHIKEVSGAAMQKASEVASDGNDKANQSASRARRKVQSLGS
jgi:hypothetical protein